VCKGVKCYEKLSQEARTFIEKVEEEIKVPVTLVGTGPGALEIVDKRAQSKS